MISYLILRYFSLKVPELTYPVRRSKMPVWGNRMVCETANYKHIEEKKKEFEDRESSLGKWASEKAERKRRLSQLNDVIRKASICSNTSQGNNPGDDTMTGSVDLVSDFKNGPA